MSLLAHGGADVINTWGFAFTGGVIGLFSLSLLYVRARVEQRSGELQGNSGVLVFGSLGRSVIVLGGVCGVSLGLGIAGLLGAVFADDADVAEVLDELCVVRSSGPAELTEEFHDDVNHVIDDLDVPAAMVAHQWLHRTASSLNLTTEDWDAAVDELAEVLATVSAQPGWLCGADDPAT